MNLNKNANFPKSKQFFNNQKDYKIIYSSCNIKIKCKIEAISLSKKSILLFNILFYLSFLLLKKIKVEEYYDSIKYDIIVPLSENDTKTFIKQIDYLKKFINFDKMIIISKNNSKIINDNISTVIINEEQLIKRENLIAIFNKRGINEKNRIYWYHQQFLKMSYSRICEKEYYLLWDSDTIPIKHINMFDNKNPIFDMKDEHHSAYFKTLQCLMPNLHFSRQSYISEHMIIKTEYMNNLLDKIENNNDILGNFFWEKIIMSIDLKDLTKSGFSEFETYGNYVDTIFPKVYRHRRWSSNRHMSKYFESIENLSIRDLNWLSNEYYTITFEKWDKYENYNLTFMKNPQIQKLIGPKRLFKYYKRIIKKYRNIG